jgi:hypothetical protein
MALESIRNRYRRDSSQHAFEDAEEAGIARQMVSRISLEVIPTFIAKEKWGGITGDMSA